MRLLITGGSGLLGSKIASIASQKGFKVYSGYNKHKSINGIPIKINICNKKAVLKAFKRIEPMAVIHAAALTDVDECEKKMDLAKKINIEGTYNIVYSSINNNNFFVYISTDYVFSGEEGVYKEEHEPKPINYYGLTKLEGEKIVFTSDVKSCIVRPSVIYGSSKSERKLNFALWVINSLKEGKPIKVVIDQWGSPTLNTNLAEMILEIVERQLKGFYHLAGVDILSRYEFAILIAETFQLDKSLIYPVKSHDMNWFAKRPRNTSLNVGKALKILRNKPINIKDALNKLKEEIGSKKA